MGLSQRGYARHRRVTLAAVQKALRTGRIQAKPDGTIDPDPADRAWSATSAPRMPPIGIRSCDGKGGGLVDAPGRWLVGPKGNSPF